MWIKTSDELPKATKALDLFGRNIEVTENVWVTLRNGKVTVATMEDGKWFDWQGQGIISSEVIAWQRFRKPRAFKEK